MRQEEEEAGRRGRQEPRLGRRQASRKGERGNIQVTVVFLSDNRLLGLSRLSLALWCRCCIFDDSLYAPST